MQEFNSASFTWKGHKGWAKGSSHLSTLGLDRFPKDSFKLKSHRSGEVRTFHYDHARMEAMEFFDGEACAYISSCGCAKIEIWC